MNDYDDIRELVEEATALKLDGVDKLDKYGLSELDTIYNGIGASWMPDWMRAGITALHKSLRPVAFVHDVDYYEGGTWTDFDLANERFYHNGMIVAKTYSWYNPRRYLVMCDTWRFYRILKKFGASAFGK